MDSKIVSNGSVTAYLREKEVEISKKSVPKYVISGKFGSMCSLKYSIAIVVRSNSSSVTL